MTSDFKDKLTELLRYVFDTEYSDMVEMMGYDEMYTVGLTDKEIEEFENVRHRSDEEIALVEKAAKHEGCPHIYATALQLHYMMKEE